MILKYIVYILKSFKTRGYYIGQTNNLSQRIKEHNSGKSKSTKFGVPWEVVYNETFISRSEAIIRETELKSIKKRYILEKLINK